MKYLLIAGAVYLFMQSQNSTPRVVNNAPPPSVAREDWAAAIAALGTAGEDVALAIINKTGNT